MTKSTYDLTGFKINKLTVIEPADDYISPKGYHTKRWLCLCECGEHTVKKANDIRTGTAKSCGCARSSSNVGRNVKDLTGQKFHRWTVLKQDPDSRTKYKDRVIRWICQCECGTISSVSGASLRSGGSKSCGCYKLDVLSTQHASPGDESGLLTVIKRLDDVHMYGRRTTMLLCQCECGNTKEVRLTDFISGDVRSCGCLATSINEVNVTKYLTEHNIQFVTQANFPDCIGEFGWRLYFNFYIPRANAPDVIIECHGNQHYQPVDYFGGQEVFDRIVANDAIKKQYAEDNNMLFIEINCSRRPSKIQIYKEMDKIAEQCDLLNFELY